MKSKTTKTSLSVGMWANAVLSVYMILVGVELLSIIPFMFIAVVFYAMTKGKDYRTLLIVSSIMMIVINFGTSDIDVLAWVLNIVLVLI